MLSLLILFSLLGAGVWWWLLRRLAAESDNVVCTADFGIGEAVYAGVLSIFFLMNIVASGGERIAITPEVLVQGLVLYGLIAGMICGMLVIRHKDPRTVFGLGATGLGGKLLTAAIALAAAYPIVYLAERVSQIWFPRDAVGDPMVKFLLEAGPLDRVLAVALIAIAAPVTEELVFRGLFYGVLRRYGGRLAAILTTSLFFAAIHIDFGVMLPLFIFAVALALTYELTGSLWTVIGMHVVFNTVSLLLILVFPEVVL